MNNKVFETAKKLERDIQDLDYILRHSDEIKCFSSYKWTYDVPKEVMEECIKVIEQCKDKYQKEFNELFENNSPKQESVQDVKPVKKPWYKFW